MRCRFAVCIPVYNNPETIVSVIQRCLEKTSAPLIVMDDGSDQSVELLCQQSHVQSERLFFLRHASNQGKGAALQTAFRYALQKGYTHLVTLDGDDQHDPADISKLMTAAELKPFALIVGDREMKAAAHVPGSSNFGKAFSNFWVHYQTDVNVADSQSGFRIYPLFFIQNMTFYSQKYDFEVEILTRLIWKGVSVENVKISVRYFPPEKRISHFHKWKDNARISVVNTFLTMGAMARGQTSSLKSALAFAVGVFIGCVPLYGFQTMIAALASFLFRLNFIYLWIGTNISLPFMIPILIFASTYLGRLVVGHQAGLGAFGEAWLVGSIILGVLLGIVSFAAGFVFFSGLKQKKNKTPWEGKNRNTLGILFMRVLLQITGQRGAYAFLYFIATYYFFVSLKTRWALAEYWKTIRPGIGFFQRQRRMFQQILMFAQILVDRGLQRAIDRPYFEYSLDASVDDFLKDVQHKKGIMMVASHVGGWELALTFFAQQKIEKNMLAVMHGLAGQYDHRSTNNDQGKSQVMYFNHKDNAILKLKHHLESGDIVGMMGDRPITQSSELIPFFGKLVLLDTTAIRAALACDVHLYFVFALKQSRTQYRIFTFKPQIPNALDREEKITWLIKTYAQYLQRIVDENPQQWFNFFRFWSTLPQIW